MANEAPKSLNEVERSFSHLQCSHKGCMNEPVFWIFSALSSRASAQCEAHGIELMRRSAYANLDELMFRNADGPSENL